MPQDTRQPADSPPYWRRKTLAEMTAKEWEGLCDGCGRCCLLKLEDIDSGAVSHTDVACRLLDIGACRCTDYDHRHAKVPDCVKFGPESITTLGWMPPTCAYRLIAEGRELPWWHHLVSGSRATVHEAGMSVRGRAVSETEVETADLERHVVAWPGRSRR
jgi:uncharacterized cysteine cluster protein YcgN (CxxCxxCC family)